MTGRWQATIWAGLWCFWVALSRNNHPTLLLDCLATTLLLAAFASAVYLNWLFLVPRYWYTRRFLAYWACLLLAVNILTVIDVVAIKQVYDAVWGPDPRRFGFWVNYELEFAGISLHLLIAAGAVWFLRRRQGNSMA